jgi:hypothetical protein
MLSFRKSASPEPMTKMPGTLPADGGAKRV